MRKQRFKPGDRVRVCDGSGLESGTVATVIDRRKLPMKQTGGGLIPDIPGYYSPMRRDEIALRTDRGRFLTMFENRLIKEHQ